MSQLTARINSKYAENSILNPDLQIFFSGLLPHCATGTTWGNKSEVLVVSPVVLHTKSSGYVGLKSSNPLQAPLMVANYLTEEYDSEVLIDGIRIIQKLMNTTILKTKYGIEFKIADYGECYQNHR